MACFSVWLAYMTVDASLSAAVAWARRMSGTDLRLFTPQPQCSNSVSSGYCGAFRSRQRSDKRLGNCAAGIPASWSKKAKHKRGHARLLPTSMSVCYAPQLQDIGYGDPLCSS
ncbi:hypothetical protein EJ02DRAFT_238315 [Clathrospora elynae]|uniref:Secreted protein n=1 Tax=Clathrospora elynae TaxID=706981 RepID=A0A6A5SL82_9PLEO|nr:hypothetical protein EJ02DRAFT_238315 [Clathrospora elynae]